MMSVVDILSAQCRAARALLGWSQEELAEKSGVARATIADFERNSRVPMRQNLVSISSAFAAWGASLLPEDGQGGAGVRLKKPQLELESDLVPLNGGWDVGVVAHHASRRYVLVVARATVDDMRKAGHFRTFEERAEMVQGHLPLIRGTAERLIVGRDLPEGNVLIRTEDFPRGSLAGVPF